MTTEVAEQLTRSTAIEQSIDPFGKEWGVAHQKQTSLYFVGQKVKSNLSNSGFIVEAPKGNYPDSKISGLFTSPNKAHDELVAYLHRSWDFSDSKVKQSAGKERAKEQREADGIEPSTTDEHPYS